MECAKCPELVQECAEVGKPKQESKVTVLPYSRSMGQEIGGAE